MPARRSARAGSRIRRPQNARACRLSWSKRSAPTSPGSSSYTRTSCRPCLLRCRPPRPFCLAPSCPRSSQTSSTSGTCIAPPFSPRSRAQARASWAASFSRTSPICRFTRPSSLRSARRWPRSRSTRHPAARLRPGSEHARPTRRASTLACVTGCSASSSDARDTCSCSRYALTRLCFHPYLTRTAQDLIAATDPRDPEHAQLIQAQTLLSKSTSPRVVLRAS